MWLIYIIPYPNLTPIVKSSVLLKLLLVNWNSEIYLSLKATIFFNSKLIQLLKIYLADMGWLPSQQLIKMLIGRIFLKFKRSLEKELFKIATYLYNFDYY